jgi:hypothetical protein
MFIVVCHGLILGTVVAAAPHTGRRSAYEYYPDADSYSADSSTYDGESYTLYSIAPSSTNPLLAALLYPFGSL